MPIMKREVVCGEGKEKNFCNNRCFFFAIGEYACFSLRISTVRNLNGNCNCSLYIGHREN